MDVIEALDKMSATVNTEELKQSVHVACDLREIIAANLDNVTAEWSEEMCDIVRSEQVLLTQQLRTALITLRILTIDHAPELECDIGDEMLQRVTQVAIQLDEDLTAVMSIVQTSSPQKKVLKETVQEKIIDEQVVQSVKEQVASDMSLANEDIEREELLSTNGIRDTVVVEQITAIDISNVIEVEPRLEDNMLIDKQADLINVETIDNKTVLMATPIEGISLKAAEKEIVNDCEVVAVKCARANGKCAHSLLNIS